MARITKEAAHNAAEAITKSLKEAIAQKKVEMGEVLYDLVKAHIPAVVLGLQETKSKYIDTYQSLSLMGNGFSYYSVKMKDPLPMEGHSSYYYINVKDAAKMTKLRNELETMEEKYERTQTEIETAILALGTYKRVEESYPEAVAYLPLANTNTGVALNLQPIRKVTKALTATK